MLSRVPNLNPAHLCRHCPTRPKLPGTFGSKGHEDLRMPDDIRLQGCAVAHGHIGTNAIASIPELRIGSPDPTQYRCESSHKASKEVHDSFPPERTPRKGPKRDTFCTSRGGESAILAHHRERTQEACPDTKRRKLRKVHRTQGI